MEGKRKVKREKRIKISKPFNPTGKLNQKWPFKPGSRDLVLPP
jgi:antitoxin component YwqK of YwqJK toxin-antitoxin module